MPWRSITLFELRNKMCKQIRYIQLVRCEGLSCGTCETAQSQTSKQAKNRGLSRDKKWTRCLILFATEVRELYKQATKRTSSEKQRLKEETASTSILLCLAVALPPSTKFTYLQHSDAYGTTHPHAARGRKCYHSQITSSSDIKERSPLPIVQIIW